MNNSKQPQLPIGYWLKRADELLTTRINEVQQAHDLSRTDWQILNVITELQHVSLDDLVEPMQPFVNTTSLEHILNALVQRRFIESSPNHTTQYQLTNHGQDVYQVALEDQKRIRQQAVQGISKDDYATTMRVLQQLVANLSTTETTF